MEELNKRVEQGKTIDDIIRLHCKTHECCMNSDKSDMVMKILDCKYADLTKDIQWVGDCDNPPCDNGKIWRPQSLGPTLFDDCPKCKGTDQITRPATLAECLEYIIYNLTHNQFPEKINGGTLRVKGEK